MTALFARVGGRVETLHPLRSEIPDAVERAMEGSYAGFRSQVALYLRPDHLDTCGPREAWDAL